MSSCCGRIWTLVSRLCVRDCHRTRHVTQSDGEARLGGRQQKLRSPEISLTIQRCAIIFMMVPVLIYWRGAPICFRWCSTTTTTTPVAGNQPWHLEFLFLFYVQNWIFILHLLHHKPTTYDRKVNRVLSVPVSMHKATFCSFVTCFWIFSLVPAFSSNSTVFIFEEITVQQCGRITVYRHLFLVKEQIRTSSIAAPLQYLPVIKVWLESSTAHSSVQLSLCCRCFELSSSILWVHGWLVFPSESAVSLQRSGHVARVFVNFEWCSFCLGLCSAGRNYINSEFVLN